MSIQWTVAVEESTGEVGPYATPFTFTLSSALDASATASGASSVSAAAELEIYLSLVLKTSGSVELSWTTGGSWAAYQVERDGAVIDTVAVRTYTDTGLDPSTEYTYRVRGRNVA